jgi:hypothetical protein
MTMVMMTTKMNTIRSKRAVVVRYFLALALRIFVLKSIDIVSSNEQFLKLVSLALTYFL